MPPARPVRIRALGEIALRCRDLDTMESFYRDIIGLEPLPGPYRRSIRFFQLGESYGGHTAVLALFAEGAPPAAGSSLHHLALTIDAADQEAAVAWLGANGCDVRVEDFPWIGWRGVFTSDPEGNTVELVAKVAAPSG